MKQFRLKIAYLVLASFLVFSCSSDSGDVSSDTKEGVTDTEKDTNASTDDNSKEDTSDNATDENTTDETKGEDQNTDPVAPDTAMNGFVASHGLLQTSGNKIVDKNNNAIQLRGMSLFWSQWMGQFYTKETVNWLADDWKCNIVRAAMGVEDNGGYLSNKEREKNKVFTVVDAAIEKGIYVIVDWHSHHAEDHVDEAVAFFTEVAKKYGDKENVIYEIYNEPLQGANWENVLKPYHEKVIAAIRKHDPDNLIVCGTRTWSQDVDEVIGKEINDKNVAYTLHYYSSTHRQSLRDKAQKALNAGLALFVTEYGVSQADGNGNIDKEEARKWWDFLDKNKISWCNWSIADKSEASAALTPGASGNGGWAPEQLTVSGKMVRDEVIAKN